MIKHNADVITAGVGVGLIAGGVAVWSWPAALIVLGLALIAAAMVIL